MEIKSPSSKKSAIVFDFFSFKLVVEKLISSYMSRLFSCCHTLFNLLQKGKFATVLFQRILILRCNLSWTPLEQPLPSSILSLAQQTTPLPAPISSFVVEEDFRMMSDSSSTSSMPLIGIISSSSGSMTATTNKFNGRNYASWAVDICVWFTG